jgi:biofilm PGA synthesis N-glycosyltransferase PgaC
MEMNRVSFSILVPCHDEEQVIEKKIRNCLQLDPQLLKEIIIIDDYSSDRTIEYAKRARLDHNTLLVKILKNKSNRGKAGAMMTGLKVAKGDIIVMTDADVMLEKDCLEKSTRYFKDKTIGAICFSPDITSSSKEAAKRYVGAYEKVNRLIKIICSGIDSLAIAHGQAFLFRKDIDLQPSCEIRGDDVDYVNQVRKNGYKCKYAKDIFFHESIGGDMGMIWSQKERRCKAVILSLLHHKDVLLNPRYGLYGFVCYPLEMSLYTVQPFLFFAIIMGIPIFVWTNYGVLLAIAAIAMLAFLIMEIPIIRSYATLNMICAKCLISAIYETEPSTWTSSRGEKK